VPTASHGDLLQNPWQRKSESQSSTFQWFRICVRARVLWYSDSFVLGLYVDLRISSARGLKMQWSRVAAVAARRCLSLPRRPPPSPAAARGLRPLHVGARPSASGPSGPWMSAARPSGLGASGRAARALPFSGALRSQTLIAFRAFRVCTVQWRPVGVTCVQAWGAGRPVGGLQDSRGTRGVLGVSWPLPSPPTPFRIHYTQRAAVSAVYHIFFKVTPPAPALAAPSPSTSSLRLECGSQGAGRLVRVCCCTAGCFNQPR
jgi:hypothetical protein